MLGEGRAKGGSVFVPTLVVGWPERLKRSIDLGIVGVITAHDVHILDTTGHEDTLEAEIAVMLADGWQIGGVLPADSTATATRIIFTRPERPGFAPA